jgi:cellulose synthase/poly-beta-1,6-N-acetylglucosamine synthase-like glycosyltransferase
LHLSGWDIEFCSTTSVHQQGLVDLRRWLRQRTRWFHGHLQAWTLVPWVLRDLTGTRRVDLLYHLTSPFLLLVGSLLTVAFGLWIVSLGIGLATGTLQFSTWWVFSYLVAFGPALLYGLVYWRREREHGLRPVAAVALLHLYVLYATLWYVAGWRAALRVLLGRNGWAKTERTTDDHDRAAARQTFPGRAV